MLTYAGRVTGIGIMFKTDMSGALYVSSVVPDGMKAHLDGGIMSVGWLTFRIFIAGPAHKAGNIMEGDVLFEVDGVNVYGQLTSQHSPNVLMAYDLLSVMLATAYSPGFDRSYRCPASQCASSLMGPRGSKVRICFLRRGRQ
jgi:hypothetical protein